MIISQVSKPLVARSSTPTRTATAGSGDSYQGPALDAQELIHQVCRARTRQVVALGMSILGTTGVTGGVLAMAARSPVGFPLMLAGLAGVVAGGAWASAEDRRVSELCLRPIKQS